MWVSHVQATPPDLGRLADLALALTILVFALPVLTVAAVLIWLRGDGPVFYGQARLGLHGRPFRCWKLRSMSGDADRRLAALLASDSVARAEWSAGRKLRVDPRVTGLGRMLRRTSVDELPQLFNVLRGEMSVVGPRPIVEAERALYGRHFALYASVKPGMTGLWQVSGRNALSYRRRVALDVAYAKNRSIALDLRILAATAPAVLTGRGAS